MKIIEKRVINHCLFREIDPGDIFEHCSFNIAELPSPIFMKIKDISAYAGSVRYNAINMRTFALVLFLEDDPVILRKATLILED